jgi:hypothetical protein
LMNWWVGDFTLLASNGRQPPVGNLQRNTYR